MPHNEAESAVFVVAVVSNIRSAIVISIPQWISGNTEAYRFQATILQLIFPIS